MARPGAAGRAARRHGDDAGHRQCRRQPRRAHRAPQGRQRRRLDVLHQLREHQGGATSGDAAGVPGVLLGRARAPGAHRRHGVARGRGGERRLFRIAAARQPARRVGVAAEPGDPEPRGAGIGAGRGVGASSRAATCLDRRSGAATSWRRPSSSSGRGDRTVCTIGCAIDALPTPRAGPSNASPLEGAWPHWHEGCASFVPVGPGPA